MAANQRPPFFVLDGIPLQVPFCLHRIRGGTNVDKVFLELESLAQMLEETIREKIQVAIFLC